MRLAAGQLPVWCRKPKVPPKRICFRVWCWSKTRGFPGFSREMICAGMDPKGMRGISFPCITSWVFGESVDVSIRSRFFSYQRGISFSFLFFSPLGFLDSIIYVWQSMRREVTFWGGTNALYGVWWKGKPFFFHLNFEIIIVKTRDRKSVV